MQIFSIAAIAVIIQLAVADGAFAQSTGTMNGVAHGTGMSKARCSPGDPNVLVNQKSKTFVMDSSAKMPAKGSAAAQDPSSMTGMTGGGSMQGGKASMVSMCKSEALSMGAHMSAKSNMSGTSK